MKLLIILMSYSIFFTSSVLAHDEASSKTVIDKN